jgi:hypothetical protein
MRQDQFTKLQTLSEKLIDVAIDEADPANWPGSGWKPNELTKEQRGDRYWCKKNAVSTVSLIERINRMIFDVRQIGGDNPDPEAEDDLDRDIAAAEKEAAKLLDKMQRDTKRDEFRKHVIGK